MSGDWFRVYAPVYDSFVRLAGVAPVAPLLELLQLQGHESVLDVGGGTGRVAAAVAGRCRQVVVLDPCEPMLRRAPSHPSVRTVLGQAQALPFADGRFDVVLCVDALHHVKDAAATVEEANRVLRPGGRVLLQEFDVRGWRGRTVAVLERLFVDDSRFLAPEELERLCRARGLPGQVVRRSWLEYAFLGRKAGP